MPKLIQTHDAMNFPANAYTGSQHVVTGGKPLGHAKSSEVQLKVERLKAVLHQSDPDVLVALNGIIKQECRERGEELMRVSSIFALVSVCVMYVYH